MNIDELKVAIEASHISNVALYVHGLQGVGKSRGALGYTQEHYHFYKVGDKVYTEDEFKALRIDSDSDNVEGLIPYGFTDMRIANMEAAEIRGIPEKEIVHQNRKLVYYTPKELPEDEFISQSGGLASVIPEDSEEKWTLHKGILLLDEINRGEDDVLNAIFQLVYDRRVGEYTIPSGWGIIAAGNPSGSAFTVNSFTDDLAFKDRFCHVFIHIDDSYKQGWMNYMSSLDDGSDLIHRISHFCMLDDGNFYNDEDREDFVIKPSPRSWEMVFKVENAFIKMGESEANTRVRMDMLKGLVGDVAHHYDECSIDILPMHITENGVGGSNRDKLKRLQRNQIQALSWGVAGRAKKIKKPSQKEIDNVIAFGKWIMEHGNDSVDLGVAFFDSILQSEQSETLRRVSIANKSLQKILKAKGKGVWYNEIMADPYLSKKLHNLHRAD